MKTEKVDVYDHVINPMRSVFVQPLVEEGQLPLKCDQYAEALLQFDVADLRAGWAKVRSTHKRQFWPPIAVLVDACQEAKLARLRKMPREKIIPGRIVDGRVHSFGPDCQCDRCRLKIPSEGGFYRATKFQDSTGKWVDPHAEAAKVERELAEWMTWQVAKLGSVIPPGMRSVTGPERPVKTLPNLRADYGPDPLDL